MGAKGFYFGALQVDEPAGKRWDAALSTPSRGNTIIYQGVGLSLAEAHVVVVGVPGVGLRCRHACSYRLQGFGERRGPHRSPSG